MITVIGNLKGGCGKSMIAFNLAVWSGSQKHPTRLLDLDPQRTLTDLVGVRDEEGYEPRLEMLADGDLAALDGGEGEVIVDVGAANMERALEVIAVAQRLIVPVMPGQADVWATQRFLRMVKPHQYPKGQTLVVLNRADSTRNSRETSEAAAALGMLDGAKLLPAKLGNRIHFCRSLSEGLAVFEMAPRTKAAEEFAALAQALYPRRKPRPQNLPKNL